MISWLIFKVTSKEKNRISPHGWPAKDCLTVSYFEEQKFKKHEFIKRYQRVENHPGFLFLKANCTNNPMIPTNNKARRIDFKCRLI